MYFTGWIPTGNYNFSFVSPSGGGDAGFKRNQNDLGGTFLIGGLEGDIETIAHESFHAFQNDYGSGGASIHNEVGAYLFGKAV